MDTALLVHSGGFTSRQWRRLAEQLAPHHRVLAPDLIGYGQERWPVGKPFHFHDDVAMLAALVDGPTHLIGHSYGGLLALHVALARPEHVRSVAVYEPVAFGIVDEPAAEIGAYDPAAPDVWLGAFVDWWNGPGAWQALAEPTRQAFRDVGWKVSQEVASLSADRTGRDRYATITAPTLLLGGARTQPLELRVLDALAATLPDARLQIFPELGHMGPITHAALVNAAIAAHVDASMIA